MSFEADLWRDLLATVELAAFLRHPYRKPDALLAGLVQELERRAA